MKKWFLLSLVMVSMAVQAQPLKLSNAAISAFAKAMQDAYHANAKEFTGMYAPLLKDRNNPAIDLKQALARITTDKKTLENMLGATFQIKNTRKDHLLYLSKLKVPQQHIAPLSDFAMYAFAKKHDADLGHTTRRGDLFRGAKLFRDEDNVWYYLVLIAEDVEIRSYPAPGNTVYKDKSKPEEVRRGVPLNRKDDDGEYALWEGVFGQMNNEGFYNEYYECTPEGKFVWGKPKSVFSEKEQEATASPMIEITTQDPGSPAPEQNDDVATFVEQPPIFPGGDDAIGRYLSENIKYPKAASEKNIEGTIFTSFIIGKDGTVYNVKTIGTKKGGGLEEEAIRVIKAMPRWKPGKQNGKEVAVQWNLPIRFTLQD